MPAKSKPLPSLSVLAELFSYDPESGVIRNKISRTARKAGERADGLVPIGYRMVFAEGKRWYAHRIAWMLHYGTEPSGYIDHINRDRSDNRISNLRLCTHSENMCNGPRRSNNTSGVKGVSKESHRYYRAKPWRAFISVGRKRINIGRFATKDEAAAAVTNARHRYHGEFAMFDD